jgi:hypothetical protein
VLNFDSTKTHGGDSFRLDKWDVAVLRQNGFKVPGNNTVELMLFDVVLDGALSG